MVKTIPFMERHGSKIIEEARNQEQRNPTVNKLLPSRSNSGYQFTIASCERRMNDKSKKCRTTDKNNGCSYMDPSGDHVEE
ncbi:MAG: hypothetical protein ACK54P_16280, partial [Bacteroidota bacterium]